MYKSIYQKIRQFLIDSKNLLWPFKWYILCYSGYMCLQFHDMVYSIKPNDPMFNSEAFHDAWEYVNYDVYIHSGRLYLLIYILILLLAISNMKNHPKLAKLILLFPWIALILGLFMISVEWILSKI